jgi:Protein of unknown function (DUF2961)
MTPPSTGRAALQRRIAFLAAAVALAFPAHAGAQGLPYSSPLSGLGSPREGRAMHEGSWDRKHLNDDALHVKPGETVTLFTHEGTGCVHRFWVTIAPREDVAVLSQAIIRMYWDDDKNPSVECPVGAFFGVGFGEQKDYISMPLDETSGGYNCYWPMPFHKSARWTLTNGAARPIDSFYYNIDYTALDSMPADTREFHAQFRRENPTTPGKNYTILETQGAGHYVGTALFMAGRALYFLEGNEMVYIDGAATPSIEGTGTEDYFSSGWYFDRGVYSAPYHGVIIKDERRSRVSAYRWHIEDAIPFTTSIRFTIEHGTGNAETADYSSVAYYYLAGQSPAPFPLPADLLPSNMEAMAAFSIPGAVEAEGLISSAKSTGGGMWSQDMGQWDYGEAWSNRRALFWHGRETDARLDLELPSPADGKYSVVARMATGPGFGTVKISLAGQPSGDPVDLYAEQMTPKEVSLGQVDAKGGKIAVSIAVAGKNALSKGVDVGIDAFIIKPVL